jgi:ribosomal protein L11 methyltransferase
MPFLQVTLEIGRHDPASFEDALFEIGALSVTLEDAADDPVLEPAPGATPLWPTVRVKALFEASIDPAGLRNALATSLPEPTEASLELLEDRPWEREWLRDFRPMRFGRRLWVCPGGMPAGEPDAVVVELDPGLAFGTGTHPTTAMCLEWLEGLDLTGLHVIDYGCGSGILGVAALKLGAARVTAYDIDPQALLATRENAARNDVADRLLVTEAPPAGVRANVLVANILAGPLVDLAPSLARLVVPGGRIALSGLLLEQVHSVTAAYRPWFDIRCAAQRDQWGLLTGVHAVS